jgi:hypothetical protein
MKTPTRQTSELRVVVAGTRRLVLALALGALAAAAVQAQPAPPKADYKAAQVLARGDTPLTLGMVNRVVDLLQELVGKPLTATQRERLRTLYVGYWRSGNQEQVIAFLFILEYAQQLDAMAPAARAPAFQQFRSEFLPALKESATTDADARWLYALVDPGAPGAQPAAAPPPAAPVAAAPAAGPAPVNSATPAPPPQLAAAAPAAAPVAMPARPAMVAPAGGVSYTAPPGWTRKDYADSTVFDANIRHEERANHSARVTVFKPIPAPRGPAAQFEAEWQRLVGALRPPGDAAVAHFRSRLPGGVDAYFMGRFFPRPGEQQQVYVVVYLLDLGERSQTIVATVVGGWTGVGFPTAIDHSAHWGLSQQLFPLLDSIKVPGRSASGPLFSAAELRGNWIYNDGGYGGSFVNAQTGASLGAAVRGGSSELKLRADGSYEYGFAMYAVNPALGLNSAPRAERHDGRYEFADDVITWRPRQAVSYDPRRKVVGAGVQQTPQGPRRLLIVVAPENRNFKSPMWVPLWSQYEGIMTWYVEDGAAR